jgi:hypothetical protein
MNAIVNGITFMDALNAAHCSMAVLQKAIRDGDVFLYPHGGTDYLSPEVVPLLRAIAEERRRAAPIGRGKITAGARGTGRKEI